MGKLSESFDFSRIEDKEQFEALPKSVKKVLIDSAHTEAEEINEQKKNEAQIEKNKQAVIVENMKLKDECEEELPFFLQKLEELLKDQASKGERGENIAIAYEILGDKSKSLELRKEILADLFDKIQQVKQKGREEAVKSLSNLNSLVVFDGLVHSPEHNIAFKPEIFSVEMVEKGRHDLGEQLDKNDFVGATDDYLSFLQNAKKIGYENLDESEKNNLEIAKNDLVKSIPTIKDELTKASAYEQLGDVKKSLEVLDKAYKRDSADKETIADAYKRLGAEHKAVEIYQKLIDELFARTRDNSGGGGMFGGRMVYKNKFNKIGELYKKIGKNSEAREMLQKYIDVYDNKDFDTSRERTKPSVAFHSGRTYGPTLEQRLSDLSAAHEELASLASPQEARSYYMQRIGKELSPEKFIDIYGKIIDNNRKIIGGEFVMREAQNSKFRKIENVNEKINIEGEYKELSLEQKELIKDERVVKKLKEWGHDLESPDSPFEFAKEQVDQEEKDKLKDKL